MADISELNTMYNNVFSLIEEELFQRLNPSTYRDDKGFDGSLESICGSSNLDIDFRINEHQKDHQKGGSNIPGKFDVIRSSYSVPLDVAIRGTIERQRLYLKEQRI
jgi:hypothetical protein